MYRDPRWEKVSAQVSSPPQGYIYEDEDGVPEPLDLTEFLIEVIYNNRIYYSRHVVSNLDLRESRVNAYKFILDKMLDHIDNHMAKDEDE